MPDLPIACPLTPASIHTKRDEALRRVVARYPGLREVPPSSLSHEMLAYMLTVYDDLFFRGFLATQQRAEVHITASTRMTRSAGTCSVTVAPRRAPRIEIRMGVDFLFRLTEGPFEVNGLRVESPLEAFFCVLEHELCHALDFLFHGTMDGHSRRFTALTQGLFGHTRNTHTLPTRAQDAAHMGCGVGHWVHFPYQGHELCGQVSRVGKTASVMVPDAQGAWHDAEGQRYAKYTVPLRALRPRSQA